MTLVVDLKAAFYHNTYNSMSFIIILELVAYQYRMSNQISLYLEGQWKLSSASAEEGTPVRHVRYIKLL